MPRRHETYSAFAIVIGPHGFRCVAAPSGQVRLIEPVLINAVSQDVLRVLIVDYVMLLVGDDKVLHATRDGMLPVDNLDLERSEKGRIG